jgi:hypothetical protein
MSKKIPRNESIDVDGATVFVYVNELGKWGIHSVELGTQWKFERTGLFSGYPSHLVTITLKPDEELRRIFDSEEQLIETVRSKLKPLKQ